MQVSRDLDGEQKTTGFEPIQQVMNDETSCNTVFCFGRETDSYDQRRPGQSPLAKRMENEKCGTMTRVHFRYVAMSHL